MKNKELKNKISKILIKYNMPTRQVVINEIMFLVLRAHRNEIVKRLEGMKYSVAKKMDEDVRMKIKTHNYAIDIAIKIIKGEI